MQALPGLIDTDTIGQDRAQRDVVLYGFGRIGRLLARLLMDRHGAGTPLVLRAIVLRPAKVANDLKSARRCWNAIASTVPLMVRWTLMKTVSVSSSTVGQCR